MITYDTIVDLRANTPTSPFTPALLTSGETIYLKGYYSIGDGGEGIFIYDISDLSPDVGGIHIRPDSIPNDNENGRWIRQYSGYLNAIYFGIVKAPVFSPPIGPSNSVRIQNAINYASKREAYYNEDPADLTIYFPSGSYFIDNTITLKSHLHLLGDTGTQFCAYPNKEGFDEDFMFVTVPGVLERLIIENFIIHLRNQENIGGFHFKAVQKTANTSAGLYRSTIRNIKIQDARYHGLCLESGEWYGWHTNQYLLFEKLEIIRTNADANCLRITGENINSTFLDCTFEIPFRDNHTDPPLEGMNVYIEDAISISFINCATGGQVTYAYFIKNSQCLTFDNCWQEDTFISFEIQDSVDINIVNSRFANAAGYGTRRSGYTTGRCINVVNSSVNVENNYAAVTIFDDDPNLLNYIGKLFVSGIANNNIINLRNNTFQHIRLSESNGVVQVVAISNVKTHYTPSVPTISGIDTTGKKIVLVQNGTSNQIKRINSTMGAGETIFIRADQNSITFYQWNPINEITGRNIYLSGLATLTLQNGQGATFIKIDGINGNEKCCYQLVSTSF